LGKRGAEKEEERKEKSIRRVGSGVTEDDEYNNDDTYR